MVVRADENALLGFDRSVVKVEQHGVETDLFRVSFVAFKVAFFYLKLVIDDIHITKNGACPTEGLRVLTASINAGQHRTVTIVAN